MGGHAARPPRRRREDGRDAASSRAPAFSFAADGLLGRVLSPPLVRAGAMLPTSTLRLDLHPADLRHARHMLALEWVLQRSRLREAVTYRQLAGARGQSRAPPALGPPPSLSRARSAATG